MVTPQVENNYGHCEVNIANYRYSHDITRLENMILIHVNFTVSAMLSKS